MKWKTDCVINNWYPKRGRTQYYVNKNLKCSQKSSLFIGKVYSAQTFIRKTKQLMANCSCTIYCDLMTSIWQHLMSFECSHVGVPLLIKWCECRTTLPLTTAVIVVSLDRVTYPLLNWSTPPCHIVSLVFMSNNLERQSSRAQR